MTPSGLRIKHLKIFAVVGLPLVWVLLLLLVLNITNPIEGGPLSVLAFFILIYLAASSLMYVIAYGLMKVVQTFGWRSPLSARRLYYLVSVLALGPVFLLALNTLGQLELKDIVLVTLLLVLGCFYVLRRGSDVS
jgi:hypothetical protein